MRIDDLRVEAIETGTEISARVGEQRLWFRMPGEVQATSPGDGFLAAALIMAMAEGERLELSDEFSVSPKLHAALPLLQEILSAWSTGLHPVEIDVKVEEQMALQNFVAPDGVIAMFSGGVDGIHTLLNHRERITHLVHIDGFEFAAGASEFEGVARHLQKVATRYEKRLVTIATNAVAIARGMQVGRDLYHGACLMAVGHLLGFREVLIPSSYDYMNLFPWGSHPFTDLIWASDKVEFVHYGNAASRYHKILYLRDHDPDMLRELTVCWYRHDVNCCECNKCVRTMIALELMDFDSPAFPEPLTPSRIRQTRFDGSTGTIRFEELIEIAKERGRSDLVRQMALAQARYVFPDALKSVLRSLDEILLAGALQRRSLRSKERARAGQRSWINIRRT